MIWVCIFCWSRLTGSLIFTYVQCLWIYRPRAISINKLVISICRVVNPLYNILRYSHFNISFPSHTHPIPFMTPSLPYLLSVPSSSPLCLFPSIPAPFPFFISCLFLVPVHPLPIPFSITESSHAQFHLKYIWFIPFVLSHSSHSPCCFIAKNDKLFLWKCLISEVNISERL